MITVCWMTSDLIFIFLALSRDFYLLHYFFFPGHITFFQPWSLLQERFLVWTSLQCFCLFNLANASLSHFVLLYYVWSRFVRPSGDNTWFQCWLQGVKPRTGHCKHWKWKEWRPVHPLCLFCIETQRQLLSHLAYLWAGCAVIGGAQTWRGCWESGLGSGAARPHSHRADCEDSQVSLVGKWGIPALCSSIPSFVKPLL